MANTDVITVRVGNGFKQRFTDLCDKSGITQRELIENLVKDYNEGKFEIEGGHIGFDSFGADMPTGVDEYDPLEDVPFNEPDGQEYFEFGFDTLVNLLRKKDYPDEYIKKMAENMITTAYDMPKFNPRKKKDDWGC